MYILKIKKNLTHYSIINIVVEIMINLILKNLYTWGKFYYSYYLTAQNKFIHITQSFHKKTSNKPTIQNKKIPEKSNSCFETNENSFRVFRGSFDNISNQYVPISPFSINRKGRKIYQKILRNCQFCKKR